MTAGKDLALSWLQSAKISWERDLKQHLSLDMAEIQHLTRRLNQEFFMHYVGLILSCTSKNFAMLDTGIKTSYLQFVDVKDGVMFQEMEVWDLREIIVE